MNKLIRNIVDSCGFTALKKSRFISLLMILSFLILPASYAYPQTEIRYYSKFAEEMSDSLKREYILKRTAGLKAQKIDTTIEKLSGGFSDITTGIFAGMQWNRHISAFSKLPGIPNCCPLFEKGEGTGFQAGVHIDHTFFESISLSLRLGWYTLDAKLEDLETKENLVRIDDELVRGSFMHHLETSLSELAVEPMVSYNPFGGLNIYGGIHLGYLAVSRFHQFETLEKPEYEGVFADTETRRRNDSSGTIPALNDFTLGLTAGIGWNLPLNEERTVFLSPEVFYFEGMNDFVKNLKWEASSVRASLHLKYIPRKSSQYREIRSRMYIDTVTVSSDSIFKEEITAGNIMVSEKTTERDNEEITDIIYFRTDTSFKRNLPKARVKLNTPKMTVSARFATEVFPALPYIFFEKNNDRISGFFETQVDTSTFKIDSLKTDPIVFHKNILNIIGKRLKKYPEAAITLTGAADSSSEDNLCTLAEKRAKRIKDYFLEKWAVDSARIQIVKGREDCCPENPTISRNDSAYMENRRVLIKSAHDSILKPIIRRHFIEPVNINPGKISARTDGSTRTGITETKLDGIQNGNIIFSKTVYGGAPVIEKQIGNETALKLSQGSPLFVRLTLTDTLGRKTSAEQRIKIIKDTSEIEVERLSLILFKVSEDEIPPKAVNDIKIFFAEIDSTSEIRVRGFSDILGSRNVNERLSANRAANTVKIIKEIFPKANIIEAKGYAGDQYPAGISSYSTPTERFLSRSVQIEIFKNRNKKILERK